MTARLHGQGDELLAVCARLAGHSLAAQVLDTARLSETARRIAENPGAVGYFTTSVFLLRGVMAGLFLERF